MYIACVYTTDNPTCIGGGITAAPVLMNLLKHNGDSIEPSKITQIDVLDFEEITFDLWKNGCVTENRTDFNGEEYFGHFKTHSECQLFRSLLGGFEEGWVNNCPCDAEIKDENGNMIPNPYLVDVGYLIPQYEGMFFLCHNLRISFVCDYLLNLVNCVFYKK